MLGHGRPGKPVLTQARELASHWGPAFDAGAFPGLGDAARARILASLELGRRFLALRMPEIRAIRTSRDVAELIAPRFAGLRKESFLSISVDVKNRPIAIDEIARGSADAVTFSPKEVFQAALAHRAHGFICVHNHPSGDPNPSLEDRALTERLEEGARLLGLRFLDHVILGDPGRFYSFADTGKLSVGGR